MHKAWINGGMKLVQSGVCAASCLCSTAGPTSLKE